MFQRFGPTALAFFKAPGLHQDKARFEANRALYASEAHALAATSLAPIDEARPLLDDGWSILDRVASAAGEKPLTLAGIEGFRGVRASR